MYPITLRGFSVQDVMLLQDLLAFAQFKKREKHLLEDCYF